MLFAIHHHESTLGIQGVPFFINHEFPTSFRAVHFCWRRGCLNRLQKTAVRDYQPSEWSRGGLEERGRGKGENSTCALQTLPLQPLHLLWDCRDFCAVPAMPVHLPCCSPAPGMSVLPSHLKSPKCIIVLLACPPFLPLCKWLLYTIFVPLFKLLERQQ